MNPAHAIRRLARILAGLAGATAAATISAYTAVPAAFAGASPRPARPAPAGSRPANWPALAPGWNKHPPLPAHAPAITSGGMPGWQVTLIAAAALVAAGLAVTGYQILAAQRRATASPA